MKGLIRIVSLLLPHFFVAVLSRRRPTDRRPLKYFLPYGVMKKRMMGLYHQKVGNERLDSGVKGLFRSVLPYGLVLWWDEVPVQGSGVVHDQRRPPVVQQVVDVSQVKSELNRMAAVLGDAVERMELLALRAVTGRKEVED